MSFYVGTTSEVDLIQIGHDVRSFLRDSRIENGSVTVAVRLPGAGILALPATGSHIQEIKNQMKQEVQASKLFLPPTMTVPVENGKMVFEPWQDLYLLDHDSSGRRREVVVQIFSEAADQKGKKK